MRPSAPSTGLGMGTGKRFRRTASIVGSVIGIRPRLENTRLGSLLLVTPNEGAGFGPQDVSLARSREPATNCDRLRDEVEHLAIQLAAIDSGEQEDLRPALG